MALPKVYLGDSAHYGGAAVFLAVFSTPASAILWAIWQANGFVDWNNFPDPHARYPFDERDGTKAGLTPLFHVDWVVADGGHSTVTEMAVADLFDWYDRKLPAPATPLWEAWKAKADVK